MDTLVSPRRRTFLQACAAAALVAGCGEARFGAARSTFAFAGPTMGSAYSVRIADVGLDDAARAAAMSAVESALAAVEASMSAFRPDSELSRFNAHASTRPFALSDSTYDVFALARDVSAASGGAFDITVAPVVDAWGFGPHGERRVVGDREVAALAPRVGFAQLALDDGARSAAKTQPDVRADLSGIAKGYAVDRAAQALDALGVRRYMVEAGGEIRTRGRNGDGLPWQIGIERPDAMPQRAELVVPLADLSIATSGDYRIWFERDGQRYCHEIDPHTGRPICNRVASVSVVAGDCGYADAMATALIVLGADEGLALAERERTAACFMLRDGTGGFAVRESGAFAALGARHVA
jgi:thiamine biosynthesis lipoprotein